MNKQVENPSEDEIDEIVTAEVDDESAWEKPIRVRRPKGAKGLLPSELAARAAVFARLRYSKERGI